MARPKCGEKDECRLDSAKSQGGVGEAATGHTGVLHAAAGSCESPRGELSVNASGSKCWRCGA